MGDETEDDGESETLAPLSHARPIERLRQTAKSALPRRCRCCLHPWPSAGVTIDRFVLRPTSQVVEAPPIRGCPGATVLKKATSGGIRWASSIGWLVSRLRPARR